MRGPSVLSVSVMYRGPESCWERVMCVAPCWRDRWEQASMTPEVRQQPSHDPVCSGSQETQVACHTSTACPSGGLMVSAKPHTFAHPCRYPHRAKGRTSALPAKPGQAWPSAHRRVLNPMYIGQLELPFTGGALWARHCLCFVCVISCHTHRQLLKHWDTGS